jgi:hypothetical protein
MVEIIPLWSDRISATFKKAKKACEISVGVASSIPRKTNVTCWFSTVVICLQYGPEEGQLFFLPDFSVFECGERDERKRISINESTVLNLI